jgi:hypothetical protein
MMPEEILDAADALGHPGCLDAPVRGHVDGSACLFGRTAESLQAASSSVFVDIERAGYRVSKVEMEMNYGVAG